MLKRIMQLARRIRAASGGTFVSFERPLAELCRALAPRRVLEFGPGKSTRIILDHSAASILSIETSREWYDRYHKSWPADRVRMIHRAPGWNPGELRELWDDFDLVFLDGGDRTAALHACRPLLGEKGLLYLHDAHREEYEPGIRTFPFHYLPERHSCIVTTGRETAERIRSLLRADYSCRCKYCDTPARNRYLASLIESGKPV